MDRRRFLSLFSAASAAAVFGSSGFVELNDSSMQLANFDVQFIPPRGWIKYVGYEVVEAFPADEMVLPEGVEMPELTSAVTPILSFSQFAEPMRGFNPNIYVCADRPEKSEAIDVMELAQFAEDDFCSMVPDPLRLVSPHRIRLNDFDAAVTMQSFQFETDYGLKVRAVRQLTVFSHREILYAIMMCNASKTKLLDEQMCFHSSVRSLVGYLTSNMRWDRLNPSVKLTHKRLVGSIEGESVVEVARRVSKKPIPVQSVFHHDRRVYHDDSNVYLGCAST